MPLYLYYCPQCDKEIETVHGISESPTISCPMCASEMRKRICIPFVIYGQGYFKPMRWTKPDREVYYPDGHHKTKTRNESYEDGVGI